MNNLDPEVQRLQQFNQELKVIKAKIEEQIKRTRKRENEALLQRFEVQRLEDEKVARQDRKWVLYILYAIQILGLPIGVKCSHDPGLNAFGQARITFLFDTNNHRFTHFLCALEDLEETEHSTTPP